MTSLDVRQRLLRAFLPFAAGYFLSYLYRTVNAVLGPVIARELALPDHALGLLTSTYFLAFGLAQLPLGILLDRFGPRRVEATLLLVAAGGAAVFALSNQLGGLALGRAMIGLGVSACLMASFKSFSQWFPPERLASLTGWVMASGGLGALAASKPLEWAIGFAGWRDIVFLLAGLTLVVAIVIWRIVPDHPGVASGSGWSAQWAGVRAILGDRYFWRYAPMGFTFIGGFMAVQGLWASRWMAVMEGLTVSGIAARLTMMSGAMLCGFLFLGFFATRLVHRGVRLEAVFLGSMIIALLSLGIIVVFPQVGGGFLWPVLCGCFSLSNIGYTLVAQAFPSHMSGRATTTYNLLVFAGAFGLQWGIGIAVDVLQAAGYGDVAAFRITFLILLVLQASALAWLLISGRAPSNATTSSGRKA